MQVLLLRGIFRFGRNLAACYPQGSGLWTLLSRAHWTPRLGIDACTICIPLVQTSLDRLVGFFDDAHATIRAYQVWVSRNYYDWMKCSRIIAHNW